YCEYYATAMIVMLRSLGIPSRMAAGYAPGTYDANTGSYVVRESSAHTWPEVYFPGYGWIEFEPTPSQQASSHGPVAENLPAEVTPEPTPNTSPTPGENGLRKVLTQQNPPQGPSILSAPGGFG